MNLRRIDLNLLVAFEALMAEGHVTRAGRVVGLTQPAMSNALARLRQLFHDELLVRTPNGMEPTPRALELAVPIRQALRQIERAVESGVAFAPETSERRFTLRMSDYVGSFLLPEVMDRLGREAPGIALDIRHLPPEQSVDALEADEIDLAVSLGLKPLAAIRQAPLFSDRLVCVARRGHPALRSPLTLRELLDLPQVRIAQSPLDLRFVEGVLAERGLERRVVLTVPHWLVVRYVVPHTDLIALIPGRIADAFAADAALQLLPPPDELAEDFTFCLFWHRRHDGEPAQAWLRNLIHDAAASL